MSEIESELEGIYSDIERSNGEEKYIYIYINKYIGKWGCRG